MNYNLILAGGLEVKIPKSIFEVSVQNKIL